MGTWFFPGVESGRGVTLTPHPLLMPRSKNRVELYLYSTFVVYEKGETYLPKIRQLISVGACTGTDGKEISFCKSLLLIFCDESSRRNIQWVYVISETSISFLEHAQSLTE
jgi:hypothetical protein